MSKTSHLFEHILTHYRGIFATVILLPISTIYSAYTTLRNLIVFSLKSDPAKHEQKVHKILEQIETWKKDGSLEKLCTARSGWKAMSELVPKYKLTHRKIDIALYDIIEIVEP